MVLLRLHTGYSFRPTSLLLDTCYSFFGWFLTAHLLTNPEGSAKPYRKWNDLVRPDSNKLVLMDNNILSLDFGIEQLASLIDSGYRIDLNQGMDARLVTDEVAEILSRLTWIKFIRFSCDSIPQVEAVQNAAEKLMRYGVKSGSGTEVLQILCKGCVVSYAAFLFLS